MRKTGLAFLVALGMSPVCAQADITSDNVNEDRAQYKACSIAFDNRLDSDDKYNEAADVCGKAMQYYARERKANANEQSRCVASLYEASSLFELALIYNGSNSQKAKDQAQQVEDYGKTVDQMVVDGCPDEPNITIMARRMLGLHKNVKY